MRLAAARRDQSIRDYVVEALTERLREDLGAELDEVGALTEHADSVLPSTVTGIIRTIKQDMISRKLGALPAEEPSNVESQLRVSLALPPA